MRVLELSVAAVSDALDHGPEDYTVLVRAVLPSLAEALELCAQLSNVGLSKAPLPHELAIVNVPNIAPKVCDEAYAATHPVDIEKAVQAVTIVGEISASKSVDPVPKRGLVAPPKARAVTPAASSTTSAPSVTATTTLESAALSVGAQTAMPKPTEPKPEPTPKASEADDISFDYGANAKPAPTLDLARVLKCKTLKDIIVELQAAGIETTVPAMTAKCSELMPKVPLLSKIPNVQERVERTMQILGLLDEADDSEDDVA